MLFLDLRLLQQALFWRPGRVSKLAVYVPCKLHLFFNWKVENLHYRAWWLLGKNKYSS